MTNTSEEIKEKILRAHCLDFQKDCTIPIWNALKGKVSMTLFFFSLAYVSGAYAYTWMVEKRNAEQDLAVLELKMQMTQNIAMGKDNNEMLREIKTNQDTLLKAINKKP